MTTVAAVSPSQFPSIVYQDQPVITSDLLAKAYGTATKNIRQNFNNKKDRFTEGKHFFSLSGKEVKGLLSDVENFDVCLKPHLSGAKITLYTKRGAALHAKMLETDQAWEVYEGMVDFYFDALEGKQPATANVSPATPDVAPPRLATKEERKPLRDLVNAWVAISPQGYGAAFKQVNAVFGVQKIDQMTPEQVEAAMAWVKARIEEAHASRPQVPALPAPEDDQDVRSLLRACEELEHQASRLHRAMEPVYRDFDRMERKHRGRWPWAATTTQLDYLKEDLFNMINYNIGAIRRFVVVVKVAVVEGQEIVSKDAVSFESGYRR